MGSLCYTFYIASFILASIPDQFPDTKINKSFIGFVILFAAALNGFGASILWVAAGRYIAHCANNSNKGTFIGIFWAGQKTSMVVGNLMGAYALGDLSKFIFFSVMTGFCVLASCTFLFLTKPEEHPGEHNSERESMD